MDMNSMGLTSGGSKDTKFQVKFNDEPEHITEDGFLRKHELWPNNGESRAHHTLGQMAEQFQEKARAAAKIGGGREIMLDEIDEEDDYEDADQELCLQGSESTGRWTKQEHELFLEALKKYGKEWKKVASMVKTRTVVQTRTHAQKYFQKLTKSINSLGSAVDEAGYEAMGFNRYSSEKKGKKSRKSEGDSPDFMQHGELMDFTISSAMSSNRNFDTDDNKFVHSTPLLSLQNINIPSAPFPPVCSYQPSPAACGKRKHAELKAAQMLAGSSSKIDMEGAHVLSMMKDGAEYHPNIDTAFNVRRGKNSLSLAINNPELFDSEEGDGGQPTTPWDSGIRALEEQTAHGVACGVSTPSQQKNFLSKVRNCVRLVDTEGLRDLLEAAEFSAQSYIASTGESQLSSVALGLANSISVSNLMSVYTPDVDRKSSGDSTPSPVHTNTKLNSATSVRRTPSTLVARSLNRVDKAEIPVIVEASNLNADEGLVVNICTLLVDHGASLAAVDGDGNSCLHIAAFRNFSRLGRFAITRGSPMTIFNTKGDAPLHIASRNGHKDFLKMLSELGMNFHLRNALSQAAIDIVGANHSTNTAMRRDLRKFLYSIEPRLRTLILYHNDCLEHVPRRPSDWEGPDRLVGIMKRLWNAKEFADYEIEISSNFEKATVEMLGRVHSADYIAFVNNLSKKVVQSEETSKLTSVPFTPHVQRFLRNDGETEELKNPDLCDTSFSPGTLNAARRAAGSVAHAVDRLLLGRNRNAFCVVRPPGHHAGYRGLLDGGSSCGFCIFNSVAAGAFHALEEHNCERVAIIDLDIHHGNGTEDIVRKYQHPSRLFFFSLHLFEKDGLYEFFPGSGVADDNVHNIINVPLLPLWKDPKLQASPLETKEEVSEVLSMSVDKIVRTNSEKSGPNGTGTLLYGRDAYRQAILQRLIPSLRAFNPDLILLSTGFDPADGDVGNIRNYRSDKDFKTLKGMDLTPEDFAWVTSEIMKIADICCNGRVVSVLEGGYGENNTHKSLKGRAPHTTRQHTRQISSDINSATLSAEHSAVESTMVRDVLVTSAAAHAHRLIDPYGPDRLKDRFHN